VRCWMVLPLLAMAGCAPSPAPAGGSAPAAAAVDGNWAATVDSLGDSVTVRRIGERVWVHVSVKGGIPSNGLVVALDGGGTLLIDTAWDDEQTGRLVDWARTRLGKPVRRAVVTHFHRDRLGGIDTLRALGIPAAGLDRTRELAIAHGDGAPDVLLRADRPVHADHDGFEVFHPGAGHSPDNVVVWLPRERVLFGGCLVKSAAARDLGNTADADVAHWDDAVMAVLARYPRAAIVVPGHGAEGGTGLLTHTRDLVVTLGGVARGR
jgi:glyoxylase-like metal-dependent hydrolase (beta-lactamase superfamily II)